MVTNAGRDSPELSNFAEIADGMVRPERFELPAY
jgi:hypothetical protein